MQQQLMPNPEQPPPESEIYPPGATIRRERIWISAGTQGTQRIYVARLGPVGLALLALIVGTMAVLALFLALGAALITVAVGRCWQSVRSSPWSCTGSYGGRAST